MIARRALGDAQKAQDEIVSEAKGLEDRLKASEERIRELEALLEEEGSESANTEILRQRLAESMEDERKQHAQDLADRDFAADQTRKKYQAELAQLSEGTSDQLIADPTLTPGHRVTISTGEYEPPPRRET